MIIITARIQPPIQLHLVGSWNRHFYAANYLYASPVFLGRPPLFLRTETSDLAPFVVVR